MTDDKKGIAGYRIEKEEDLILPWVLHHKNKVREILARETLFSAPLAISGATVAGVPGVVAGHVTGALLGFKRERNIEEVS